MKGKIIVIEGTDCSGKETQTKLLADYLTKNNIKCLHISFPVYDSPTGKIIGGPYLGKKEICNTYFEEQPTSVDPYVSCLYYAADRKYNISKIMKYMDEGYIILFDRYTTSNMAHQGCKITNSDERFNMYQWIDKLEFWLLKLPKPDITIYLHMPYQYTCILKNNRVNLDENETNEDYLKNAERSYIELSELYNWDRIECVENNKIKPISQIHEEIIQKLKEKGL